MFASMPFNPQRDLRPVALLANSQLFLFVRSSLGVDTLEAFVEYARKRPDPLNYGSAGNGTTPHLAGELLKQATGIPATMHRIAAWRRRYKIWRQARSTSRLDPPRSFPWCRRAS